MIIFELMYVLEGELTNKIERISYTYKKGGCLPAEPKIPGTWISQAPRCSVVFINFHAEYILDLMDRDVLFDLKSRLTSPDGIIHDFPAFRISGEKNALPAIIWNFPPTLHALSSPFGKSGGSRLIDRMQQSLIDNRPGYSYFSAGTAASPDIYAGRVKINSTAISCGWIP